MSDDVIKHGILREWYMPKLNKFVDHLSQRNEIERLAAEALEEFLTAVKDADDISGVFTFFDDKDGEIHVEYSVEIESIGRADPWSFGATPLRWVLRYEIEGNWITGTYDRGLSDDLTQGGFDPDDEKVRERMRRYREMLLETVHIIDKGLAWDGVHTQDFEKWRANYKRSSPESESDT